MKEQHYNIIESSENLISSTLFCYRYYWKAHINSGAFCSCVYLSFPPVSVYSGELSGWVRWWLQSSLEDWKNELKWICDCTNTQKYSPNSYGYLEPIPWPQCHEEEGFTSEKELQLIINETITSEKHKACWSRLTEEQQISPRSPNDLKQSLPRLICSDHKMYTIILMWLLPGYTVYVIQKSFFFWASDHKTVQQCSLIKNMTGVAFSNPHHFERFFFDLYFLDFVALLKSILGDGQWWQWWFMA